MPVIEQPKKTRVPSAKATTIQGRESHTLLKSHYSKATTRDKVVPYDIKTLIDDID